MKGFIACALAMAPRFASAGLLRPVHIALTFDEEVGCLGAPILIDDLIRNCPTPLAAIVGEPTDLRIIEAHKGCYEYTTTITGLEGHGSAPAKGVNAVEYGVRFISRLMEIGRELEAMAPVPSEYDPPHTTLSVGAITGGTARNIVAGTCTFDWEMRPVRRTDAEYAMVAIGAYSQALLAEMRKRHPDAAITTETIGAVDGLEPVASSPAVELAMDLTGATEVDVVSFGTEAGLYQDAGIPAVVCGPGSIDVAHRPDEFIEIDQLESCLRMLERLSQRLTVP
jgi:acetylornithine deacetylase